MKGKFGKIGIICLALVICLAGLGAAFAFWTEPLTVSSTVSTGYLQLKLTDIVPSDNYPYGDLISCEKIVETGDSVSFDLTVTDAYPGYEGRVDFKIENTGTIPAYIEDIDFDGSPAYPSWAHIGWDDIIYGEYKTLDVAQSYDAFITVTIDAPGDDVPENYSFTFTVTIQAMQWNYAP